MSFLKQLGQITLAVSKVAPIVGPIITAIVPNASQVVTRATSDIDQIASIIANVEVMGQALQLQGPQKLTAATPLIAQMVLQSSALAGKEIANPELFKAGCEKIGSGMADVLNAVKA